MQRTRGFRPGDTREEFRVFVECALALDEAARDGRIRPGQHVLMEAIGGGFAWGAVLVKW